MAAPCKPGSAHRTGINQPPYSFSRKIMLKNLTRLTGAVLLFSLSFIAQAEEKLFVQVPAVLAPDAPITPSVKRECAVELLLGNHVFEQVNQRLGTAVQLQDITQAGSDKVLSLTLLDVYGVGGGNWSGAKAITLKVELSQGGKVLATKILRRSSRGGIFGGMSGTCPIFERTAIALGKDVARWIPDAMKHTVSDGASSASATDRTDPHVDVPAGDAEQ
jgi:hypothetical protein